jgi:hypothetical protein
VKIIYTPGKDSHFTGMLSGLYYVDGMKVTEQQFREHIIMRGVEQVMEVRSMDIVKRAYLKTIEEWPKNAEIIGFEAAVLEEIKRLIRVRVYSGRDWPRELGPLPKELRSKRDGQIER